MRTLPAAAKAGARGFHECPSDQMGTDKGVKARGRVWGWNHSGCGLGPNHQHLHMVCPETSCVLWGAGLDPPACLPWGQPPSTGWACTLWALSPSCSHPLRFWACCPAQGRAPAAFPCSLVTSPAYRLKRHGLGMTLAHPPMPRRPLLMETDFLTTPQSTP